MFEITSNDDDGTLYQKGKNRLIGAVFFQRLFAVLFYFRCKQEGTVSINTVTTYGTSKKVLINCTYCDELITTWTQRQLSDYNHSPFLYNVVSESGS